MCLGFDWDTNEMSVMLLAKLAKPRIGTARIVINKIHIKGGILITPILDGQALLYSFESTPEVRIGVVFGSDTGSALPATELPGVSTWLVKIFTETLAKTMVEPRRACFSLPSIDRRKKAVGGLLSVTVVSASNLHGYGVRPNNLEGPQNFSVSSQSSVNYGNQIEQTFIEVELGDLTRKTNFGRGLNPRWNAAFNLAMHGDTDVWIPLEKMNYREERLQIKVAKNNGHDGNWNSPPRSFSAGWIELVLIEARDLVAADLRGTSDPYVRAQYGHTKKRTKVVYTTLNPQCYQTLEFPDTGSRLLLHLISGYLFME